MRRIDFFPLDTLFFRDGSPFNAGELQSGAATLFPPSPATLVGAVRAALARDLGWDGRNRTTNWDDCCRTSLGTGRDLGPLSFCGPWLYLNGQPVYPAPADLLGTLPDDPDHGKPANLVRLRPGPPRTCDLGTVRLPELPGDSEAGNKPLFPDWWVTAEGFEALLKGQVPAPETLVHRQRLWRVERRVGIRRDPQTRTTPEQGLYAPRHIRLAERVRLAMFVDGLDADFAGDSTGGRLQAVGGESRSCWLRFSETDSSESPLPKCPLADAAARYAAIVMTPLAVAAPPVAGRPFCGLPGRVVSACLPRPQFWGGWDSVTNRPLPLAPHLPPGSVLFMESEGEGQTSPVPWHGSHCGDHGRWGFGAVALGVWNS